MKYVRVIHKGVPVWGIAEGEKIRILRAAPYENIEYNGEELSLAESRLLAPCEPTKIVCVGKNYLDHAREMGGEPPAKPVLFLKGLNTLNHPEGEIQAPAFVERLDYEGELAVVVKKRAKNVKENDFSEYVLGFTCLNDVTARDIQYGDGQWTRGKSMDGFAPIGPLLTDEIDGGQVAVETRLNGETVQKGNTAQFIHGLPELFAFITASMTLEPGDVIATGTPAGVGPMRPGDVVEVEIEGIGVLRNHVR